jgi:PPOX class probable F420-dependent enzyme
MGVRLSEEEAWAELDTAHTGILTTLRRDGRPVSLPVWFATVGRTIYVRTPAKTRKVEHVRNDPRATFLVERGEKWIELCAVMVYADVELLESGDEFDAASAAITAKYAGFRMESKALGEKKVPEATKAHYAGRSAMLRLTPSEQLVTWDNSRLRLT